MSKIRTENIILAVPKGRILEELVPLMKKANIIPEKAFFDTSDRKLLFSSNIYISSTFKFFKFFNLIY